MNASDPAPAHLGAASEQSGAKPDLSSRTVRENAENRAGIRSTVTVGLRVDAIASIDVIRDAVIDAIGRRQSLLMTFVNPSTAMVARRDARLREQVHRFDIVAPDGSGMVMAMRILRRAKDAKRISFDNTSLAPVVFDLAAKRQLDIVIVGGRPHIAELAKLQIEKKYPDIRITAALSGFEREDKLTELTSNLSPAIVIAGMGTSAQESFLLKLSDNGWRGIGFTCGGYLDQLVLKGDAYYPAWIDRLDLRWAYRLWMEPRRLWRRYLLEYPGFLIELIRLLAIRQQKESLDGWRRPNGLVSESVSTDTSVHSRPSMR